MKQHYLLHALIILVALARPSGALAQGEGYDLTLEPYTFTTNDGKEVAAELGTFYVPENRKADTDARIRLAFVRFKSTHPQPGSPIVYLAGGPGGAGTGTAQGSRFDLFMAMRAVGDVIAFDQRGTGLSHTLPPCPHEWTYPLDAPATREALAEAARANAQACASYWSEEGVDLAAYNTNESADDLEDLRTVLDVDKISLWGISYGTHLALAALKRHGAGIDRVILAGLEGPDHTLKLPSDQQEMLEKIDALIKEDPVLSARLPDFMGLVQEVLKQVEQEPVTASVLHPETGEHVAVTIGLFDVQRVTTLFLRGPSNFKDLLQVYHNMGQGDFSDMAALVWRSNRSGRLAAMPAAMDAASGASEARLARMAREEQETLLGSAINFPYPDIIGALGVPDVGPAFRMPVQSEVPALFISGTLDGRTSVRNAEEILPGFPQGVHLILDGAGHSDPLFLSSPRIEEVMLAFMQGAPVQGETLKVPVPDLHFKVPVPLDTEVLERYVGAYEGGITITQGDGTLIVEAPQGIFMFFPESETSFFLKESDVSISFEQDEAGAVSEAVIKMQGQTMTARRVDP